MKTKLQPNDFGLQSDSSGELVLNGIRLTSIAEQFGTPVYVLNENRLKKTAAEFKEKAIRHYSGKTSVHYAFKCNSVPYPLQVIKNSGLSAEVMTEFELALALKTGFKPDNIIVNGPGKTTEFLSKCISEHVRLIILDSFAEIYDLENILNKTDRSIDVLLRINPDYVPSKMNPGSSAGSRKSSVFGFDIKSGEIHKALKYLKKSKNIKLKGFHFHIGTGISEPEAYSKTIKKLEPVIKKAIKRNFSIEIIDVGGGFASSTTREFNTKELLMYQAFNRMPSFKTNQDDNYFDNFFSEISSAIRKIFNKNNLPEIIYEPGRSIVSSNQILLLRVNRIKERKGAAKWLITDGGLGTITLPTFYEYHELFLSNNVMRPKEELVTITGSCCFSADVVYRNINMPKVKEGEILALMDTGAYFNTLESSFGFPKPAIVTVKDADVTIIRKRETFDDMVNRDINLSEIGGTQNEIHSYKK